MDYEETTLEDIFLAMTDDNVYPDEDGNLPSIEEILSRRGKTSEIEVEEEEASEPEEETDSGEEYTPLFSTDREEDNE